MTYLFAYIFTINQSMRELKKKQTICCTISIV